MTVCGSAYENSVWQWHVCHGSRLSIIIQIYRIGVTSWVLFKDIIIIIMRGRFGS